MEETNHKHTNVIDDKDHFIISPESLLTNRKDHDIENKEYCSEFDLLKSGLLSRIEFLEKEIKEVRKRPTMVDFSCQTDRTHYDPHGDKNTLIDVSTQTYLENTNATLLNISFRLEELKYCLNDKIDKLQYSLKHSVSTSSLENNYEHSNNDKNNNENVAPTVTPDVYVSDRCKVKYTPYSLVKPTSESSKFRSSEDASGKPLDIRASLENSKQLFQQEIEASLQHGRMQQQANGYAPPRDKKPSAFTQYMPYPNHVINSKGMYNVYNSPFYDGRRSMYYEKHPFQISREEYARELVDEIFAYDELAHANVTGVKGKRLLDQKKIQVIKDSVLSRYPLQPSESEEIAWKLICDKINTKCRGVTRTLMKRKANNTVNGYPLDYYPVRKKSGEIDYFYDMPPSMASSMYQNTPIVSPVGVWSSNDRETDKSRDNAYNSDPPITDTNIVEEGNRESVVSDPDTSVNNQDTNITYVNNTTNNYQENRLSVESSEPSEEINASLTQSYDNDSNSNSLDHSEDRNNVSFSQCNDDELSNNDEEMSKDDYPDSRIDVEEPRYTTVDTNINRTDVTFSTGYANKVNDGFKSFSIHKPNIKVTGYHGIQTQPSFTYPPGTVHSNMSNTNTFNAENRKFCNLSPESRKFCRQECSRGSRKELTRNLIDSMFSRATLAHSNVTGARGKSMLEPSKIAKVREMVFAQYPANNKEEEEVIWRKLTTKINTKCRGVKRFLKRKNLLEGGTLSAKERIMRDIDGSMEKGMLRNTLGLERDRASSTLEKMGDYQYVSMVGRTSYPNERLMRDIDGNVEKSMLRSSLGLDRYGSSSSLEKMGDSQYASMVGSTSSLNGRVIRDADGNMDKSMLRTMLGLDRNVQSSTPERINNSQYVSMTGGVSTPDDRATRDSDGNIDKNIHMSPFGIDRNVASSTTDKTSDAHYASMVSGVSTPSERVTRDMDSNIENNMHRSAFGLDRNVTTSTCEKLTDSQYVSMVSGISSPRERGSRDIDGNMEKNIHRSAFGIDRNVTSSTSEQINNSQCPSTASGVSTPNERVSRDMDSNIENNMHRSAYGLDRSVTSSTSEKINDGRYVSMVSVVSTSNEAVTRDSDSNIENNIHRSVFGLDRNVTSYTGKPNDSHYISMVSGVPTPNERVTRDMDSNIESNMHRSAFGLDRNGASSTCEKIIDSQYVSMVSGISSPRERGSRDIESNLEKNIHRSAFGIDRNGASNTEKLNEAQYLSMVGGVSSPKERVLRDFDDNMEKSPFSGSAGLDRNVASSTPEKMSDSQYVSMVGRSYNM